MERKRAKTNHGKYGDRQERIGAYVSKEAKEGLYNLAKEMGVSFNELMEKLGRKEVPMSLGE
jgi:hypothetical protein